MYHANPPVRWQSVESTYDAGVSSAESWKVPSSGANTASSSSCACATGFGSCGGTERVDSPSSATCTRVPKVSVSSAYDCRMSKVVQSIPAAIQSWPMDTPMYVSSCARKSFSDGFAPKGLVAWLAPATSGYAATLSTVGRRRLRLKPNPPEKPVTKKNGGPPVGTSFTIPNTKNEGGSLVAYEPKAVSENDSALITSSPSNCR